MDQATPLMQQLDDIVSWKTMPPFSRAGRSALLALDEPIEVDTVNGKVRVDLLKIKGVGLYDYDGNISQPSSTHFQMIVSHLSITKDGDFSMIPPSTKPLGGLILPQADMEYMVADRLFANNIPTEIPIRLYHYKDPELFFETKAGVKHDLGVVVVGQHNQAYDRADIALNYHETTEESRALLDNYAKALGIDISIEPELTLFAEIYRSYGHYIRKYSECGLYRHSGHGTNIGLSLHTKSIYFSDIDSCRFLSECGKIDTPLQVMRDALSGIYNLLVTFTEPDMATKFSSERVIKSGVFRTFLQSYYDDVDPNIVAELSKLFEHQYIDNHHRVVTALEQNQLSIPKNTGDLDYQDQYLLNWKRTETDYVVIYSWGLAVLWHLHSMSNISDQFPFQTTEDEYFQKVAELSSPELVSVIRSRIKQIL